MNQKKIGKFISELRKEHKLTQECLAEKLFVDRATISKWETGNYIASPEILLKLSKLFDVSINEILAGERGNSNNQDKINEVTVEILKDSRDKSKQIKRLLLFSIISIIGILILFLSYYFITNYNSISVYTLSGESENFYIDDGLIVFSKEKAYITLGQVKNRDNKNIDSIRLYYLDGNKQIDLLSNNDYMSLIINIFGTDELFSYKKINFIKQNLYLEIILDGNIGETVKLKSVRDFSNVKIFNNQQINEISDDNINDVSDTKVPKFVKNNFQFKSDTNEYILEINKNDTLIKQKYIADVEMYVLDKIQDKSTEHFDYSNVDSFITYSKIEETNMTENFTYNFKNKTCFYGNCDLKKINYFINNYLDKLY